MRTAKMMCGLSLAALLSLPGALRGQGEDGLKTQALLTAESKQNVQPQANALTIEVNGKKTPLTSLERVAPEGAQVALLIDDGLSRSAGVQLEDLRGFAKSLPPGTELTVGYMSNGRVLTVVPFTTEYERAAEEIRLPMGQAGQSASPYFCLSDFVKKWPGSQPADANELTPHGHKARFVLMITNGVDPYNGSVALSNQNSPYVDAAIKDSQRAGVAVSSVYYSDAGLQFGAASFSGQSYLREVADGTGGQTYYQGIGNPVSLKPFLNQFKEALAETYIATFPVSAEAGGGDRLAQLKVKTSTPGLKVRHPDAIRPGNREGNE